MQAAFSDILKDFAGFSSVHVLITSRKAVSLAGALVINLSPLPEDLVEKLLHELLPGKELSKDQCAGIAAACSCNALLLTTIAGFINGGRVTAEVRWLRAT